eukprot:TRINITY_DN9111_c0_g1_i3.p1 TRINITY_DN9111_c0_g1~~TRINITY_DN9111_c0_g1_i3.p1  ORF type:complete len:241 (+),score=79.86 TRINITY_DN9111_c0_g1_i3:138-860(+)
MPGRMKIDDPRRSMAASRRSPAGSAAAAVAEARRAEMTQLPSQPEVKLDLETLEKQMEELQRLVEAEQADVDWMQRNLPELGKRDACEEYLLRLERRVQQIENRGVETVQWRIENVEELCGKHRKGSFVKSPEFSACGLSGFSFHFYPRGDDFAEEGNCSLYFHVPEKTVVSRTLFLGRARHGPAEAEATKNVGVSDLCRLQDHIDQATRSVIVGVDGLEVITSPDLLELKSKLQLKVLK